jgi:hypothetical protein
MAQSMLQCQGLAQRFSVFFSTQITQIRQINTDKVGVIPAKAGISLLHRTNVIPACAGMTGYFIL